MEAICNIPVERPTAPDLILDLLVANGRVLTVQALCRAGALLGISDATMRVGLTRLASQGKITHSARGLYALNRSGPALARDIDAWRRKGSHTVAWRGQWLAVQDAGVPRSDKTAWRRHSLALQLRGLAPFQPGLQLRPDNLLGGVGAVRAQLLELGLAPQALVFCLDGLDAERSVQARGLWDVAAYLHDYRRLQQALEDSGQRLRRIGLAAAARESLLLGRAVIAYLVRDPLLPPELMPADARLALMQKMQAYQDAAVVVWRDFMGLPAEAPRAPG